MDEEGDADEWIREQKPKGKGIMHMVFFFLLLSAKVQQSARLG